MIRLTDPRVSETAIRRAVDVIKTGILVQSTVVSELETLLAQYLGVQHVVVVSSGTAALHIALMSLEIGKDDEVIIPAFTFPATANVVELVGATPVLVDITTHDCCIDVSKIETRISSRTRVLMPVHEFGQSADCAEIKRLAEKHGLRVVEDAACALGTRFEGKAVGSFGHLGCFSFHPRKAITTGEGGCVATNDGELAARLRLLRNHGMALHEGKLDFHCAGFNYRMTEFQAALGVEQLKEFDHTVAVRAELAASYNQLLSNHPLIAVPEKLPGRDQVFQTYHLILAPSVNRDAVIARLKQKGIETNYGAQAVHMTKFYREKYRFAPDDFPAAQTAYRQGLALPMGIHLTLDDTEQVAHALLETVAEIAS